VVAVVIFSAKFAVIISVIMRSLPASHKF